MTQKTPAEEQVVTLLDDGREEAANDEDILVTWKERQEVDDARVGAMYCFKNCGKNKN